MTVATILFPFGARLSTWVAGGAFVVLAAKRRDGRVLFAGWAWLTGFEAAFQMTSLLLGHPLPFGRADAFMYVIPGLVTVPWAYRQGIRPSVGLMAVVAAIWTVWIATGFHVNSHTGAGFDPGGEALNEAAKTVWALAYLVPFLVSRNAGISPRWSSRLRWPRLITSSR